MAILVSEDQNQSLAITDQFIRSFGVTWVVVQYDLSIQRLPKTDEQITLQTRSTSYNKFFAFREFWVLDADGNQCAYIQSLWVAMNVAERKLAPIPPAIVAPYDSKAVRLTPRFPKPQRIHAVTASHQYRIRYSDIDTNLHVNNTRYLDWMLDVLPYDFLVHHVPTSINLKYNNEVRYGTNVQSNYQQISAADALITNHEISNEGQLAALANITWRIDDEIE